jgi:2-keto-4-pentenoate hydratase/2-oxohepta-3-ene-1,7-dioic acid hydratase in catechol pathway
MYEKIKFTDGYQLEVGTMYCIGKNYAKHAAEMGGAVPKEPVVFLKPPAAYIPDGAEIIIPDFSNNVHHEVELVVAIGKDATDVSKENALDYVAGYAVGIDVTLRDVQQDAKDKGKPWTTAKAFRTSAPISKFIPASEVGDDNLFDLELKVNGEIRQQGNTKEMERSVETLIEYLSKVFTLRKGDLIFTGTPEGVGQINSNDKLEASLVGYVSLNIKVK